jgi:hypothetical protein
VLLNAFNTTAQIPMCNLADWPQFLQTNAIRFNSKNLRSSPSKFLPIQHFLQACSFIHSVADISNEINLLKLRGLSP